MYKYVYICIYICIYIYKYSRICLILLHICTLYNRHMCLYSVHLHIYIYIYVCMVYKRINNPSTKSVFGGWYRIDAGGVGKLISLLSTTTQTHTHTQQHTHIYVYVHVHI